jgi:hypothetical protein
LEVVEDPVFLPGEAMGDEQFTVCNSNALTSLWTTKQPPNVLQAELSLQSRIEPSPRLENISLRDVPISLHRPSDSEIRKRVALGLPNGFALLNEFLKTADGTAFVTITSRLLSCLYDTSFPKKEQIRIRNQLEHIDISESDSMIRDIAKGYFFELLHIIKASPPLLRATNDALKQDLTIRMILLSKTAAEKEDFELKAKERNTLKSSLRSMNDTERELTQRLLELGLADFIITNVDRKRFVRELNYKDPELEEVDVVDMNRPEEGYNVERDYVENGDQPIAEDGTQLQVDYGDYGDRAVRDYDDYTSQNNFDEDTL